MMTNKRTEQRPDRIVLVLNHHDWMHTEILDGIRAYMHGPGVNWRVRLIEASNPRQLVQIVHNWGPSGIIMAPIGMEPPPESMLGVPLVAVSGRPFPNATACVLYDMRATARLATQTLATHPITSAGCVFFGGHEGSVLLKNAFVENMRDHGIPCDSFEEVHVVGSPYDSFEHFSRHGESLEKWLKAIPKPCGILAWHDALGIFIVDVCHDAGLEVPHDVLVLSQGNSETLCNIADPSLSSIEVPIRESGWIAARTLHTLIQGGTLPSNPILLPPTTVHARASTQRLGTRDPLVSQALTLIKRGWLNQRTVQQLAQELKCSRRVLERRFRNELRKTVLATLQEHRIEKATVMLRDGAYSIAAIAKECGFQTSMALEALLKQHTGKLPRDFRRFSAFRTGGAPSAR